MKSIRYRKTYQSLAAAICLSLWSMAWAAAPTASFIATPDSGPSPLTVNLDAGASSDDGGVIQHDWTINGQPISLGTNTSDYEVTEAGIDMTSINGTAYTVTRRTVTVQFKTDNTYTVGLKVKDNEELFSSQFTKTVKVGCSYTLSPASRDHGPDEETGSVTVNTQSGCNWQAASNINWAGITSGSSGTGNGTVTYGVQANTATQQRAGALTIAGNTFSLTQQPQSPKQAPTASFTASPANGTAPLKVTLDYSASKDPDGQIVSYQWAVNGQAVEADSSAQEKTITLTSPGTYTISLTVTDNDGLTDKAEQTVVVEAAKQAPAASFTASPAKGIAPLKVILDYSASKDPDGQIVSYQWAVNGQAVETDSSAQEKTITLTSPGTYTISLTVTDNDGLTDKAEQTVVVEAAKQAPAASFTASPAKGIAPLKVILDYSASKDPDGQIVSYQWAVNGQALEEDGGQAQEVDGSVLKKTITLTGPGTYTISLKVTDNDGLTDETKQTVVVDKPANKAPVASFTASPASGTVPLKVVLDPNASHDPDGQIARYVWQVNGQALETEIDGVQAELDATGLQKTITFTSPGTYTLTLTVIDNEDLASEPASQTVKAEAGDAISINPDRHDFGTVPMLAEVDDSSLQAAPESDTLDAAYVPGQVIVKFHEGSSSDTLNSLDMQEVQSVDKLPLINAEVWQVEDVTGFLSTQAAALSGSGEIEYIEPDYLISINAAPNDPDFSKLWGMHNSADTDIDAPEAWDVIQGGTDLVCAVTDTGVDYTHSDLAANIWQNEAEYNGVKGVDDDKNGYIDDIYGYDFANNDADPRDDHNHGTHVAGTIAAVGNNRIGVTGVNWQGRIAALKFLNRYGSGSISNAVRAVAYAAKMGFGCINASWGGGGYSRALYDAIRTFGAQGGLFIAAAGNSARNSDSRPMYPAAYNLSNIVSVCASDNRDRLASFSNYGAKSVDLCAPGIGILSTVPNNRYAAYNGTSMASPHVAGAAALLWAAQPDLTATQVKAKLMASADVKSSLRGRSITGGRLNLSASLSGRPREFTVTNTGQNIVTLSQISLSGQNPADFEIRQSACQANLQLQPGGACGLTVSFAPRSSGDKQAALLVKSTGGVSLSAALSGNARAVNSASEDVFAGDDGFGIEEPAREIFLYNLRTAEVELPSLYIAGDASQQYSIKLCPAEGGFSICGNINAQAGSLDGLEQPVNAIYDPVSGVLEIPFIQTGTVSEEGVISVDPGGYAVKMQVIMPPDGGIDLQLIEAMPIW
ncbi:MAG: S8 family serine peptidase [Gammaproteobacteria bacterium]|nr:S8 family serine peptidase [Gammaproteobacteria bacterium]